MFAFADPAWRTHRIWLGVALALIVLYFMLIVLLAPGAPFLDDIYITASVERARAPAIKNPVSLPLKMKRMPMLMYLSIKA